MNCTIVRASNPSDVQPTHCFSLGKASLLLESQLLATEMWKWRDALLWPTPATQHRDQVRSENSEMLFIYAFNIISWTACCCLMLSLDYIRHREITHYRLPGDNSSVLSKLFDKMLRYFLSTDPLHFLESISIPNLTCRLYCLLYS